jgi:tryptophan 2,3-dioxygenase
MVERTIGAKRGTGGSTGTAYLQETVGRPLFPDLWKIRSQLQEDGVPDDAGKL